MTKKLIVTANADLKASRFNGRMKNLSLRINEIVLAIRSHRCYTVVYEGE